MNKKRFLSWVLLLCTLVTLIPFGAIGSFAESAFTDAMTDIEKEFGSEAETNYQIGNTITVDDNGYVGSLELTVYFDKANHVAKTGYYGSHLVMYVVNTRTERIGTKSDAEIIRSMLDRGYIVAVADYKNAEKACGTDLDFSLNYVRNKLIVKGNYLTDSCFPSGTFRKHYIVPAGYDISPELVYWEADKHATDGTLEEIVDIWNSDLKGIKGQSYVKWTYTDENGNTVRKKVTDNVVWYSDNKGTVNMESGEYTMLKYTVAESIHDCVNPDGTPIDLNLYVNVIYPTAPKKDVPVIAQHNSSGSLWDVGMREDRPHFNGFLFNGYAGVCYDYLYIPMARDNSFGYFDGNDTGYVTGDPISYSADLYSDKLINTAAMRYIRYLSLSDHGTYSFDNSKIGVYGVSKGGTHPFLGEAVIQTPLVSDTEGMTEAERLNAINDKLTAFTEMRYLPGCDGSTRYQNGKTATVTEHGSTIDGGELQPWLLYEGEEIISGAQMIYASCPNNEEDLTVGHAPTFISVQLADEVYSNSWGTSVAYHNLCRELDIPSAYFEVDEGHSLCVSPDVNYGVVTLQAFYDFAGYYLKGDAVKVLYVSPVNNSLAVSQTSDITVKFTGPVSADEIAKVKVVSASGKALSGSWSVQYGSTEWTFAPSEPMEADSIYTVTVPADLCGDNGKAMGSAYSSVFTTETAVEFQGETVKNENGTYVTVTVPDMKASGANALALRVNVPTAGAANALDIYEVTSVSDTEGELVGSIYLRGAGFYSYSLTEYLYGRAAGEKAVFLIKQQKTAVTDKSHYTENFDSGIGDCVKGSYAQYEKTTFDGKTALKLQITDDNVQYAGNPYYLTPSDIFTNSALIKNGNMTESDYGRRFTVSVTVYDTVSRRLIMSMAGCDTARNQKAIDTDRVMYNFTTVAGEWTTFTINYTVYDSDYGVGGDHRQSLTVAIAPDGSKESPIYIDSITVTETVTDVEIADADLVAYNEGSREYKAPTSEKPFALYDASGAKIGEYDTWNAALSAYSYGYTVKLQRDYTFVSADAFTGFCTLTAANGADGHTFNIDLNGYAIHCEGNTPLILLKTTSATIAKTTVNLYGGTVFLTGAPIVGYDGSTTAGNGKAYSVNLTDLEVVIRENFTPYGVVSANTITGGCTVNTDITLTNCVFDATNKGLETWCVSVFKAGSGALTTSYTVAGGDITVDSFRKISVHDGSTCARFVPYNGNYTTLTVPSHLTVASDSYVSDTGYRSYTTTESGNGLLTYTLTQGELSTLYGVIPEEYADAEKYPFVIFNKNGEFQAATAVWGADGKTSALHTGKNAGDGAVVLLRRDYELDNKTGFNNLSQVSGSLTIDLGGHTFTVTANVTMLNAESKDNHDTVVTVKNGTVRTATAAIVRFSSAGFDSYKGQKNFGIVLENLTLGFAEGVTGLTNLLLVTWSPTTAKGANASLTLKNCDIDLVTNAPASGYTLFNGNDGSSNVKASVILEGGSIKADSFEGVKLASMNVQTASSIRLNKDADGEYTTLLVKDAANIPGDAINTEDGYRAYVATDNVTADGYTECELSGDLLVTQYGVVPNEYKDMAFVAFSNGVCIGGSNKFFNGGSGILGIAQAYMKPKNESLAKADGSFPSNAVTVQIVALKDHSTSGESAFDNLATVPGELTIDLNGRILTVATWQGIRLQSKIVSYKTSLIFKNGNICVAQNDFISLKSWTVANCVEGKKFALRFEDIDFSLQKMSNGSTPGSFVGFQKQGDVSVYFDISFKDCTFDLTNATSKITLFKANDPTSVNGVACTKSYTINYTLEGCDIKATALSKFAIWGSFNSVSSYSYEKSEKTGLYTTITLPTSAAAPTEKITIDGKSYGYAPQSEADGYKTYALGEITKYGAVPPKYASVDDYPILLFHNGVCVFGHTKLLQNSNVAEDGIFAYARRLANVNADQKLVVLFRKDYAHTGGRFDNLAQFRSPITIDLNGYTITNNSTSALFQMQMKVDNNSSTAYETHVKIVNGTVTLSKAPLVYYTTFGEIFPGNKKMTLTLENVSLNFSEGASAKKLAYCALDDDRIQASDLPISIATLNLINCNIDLTNAPAGFTFADATDPSYNATYPKIRMTVNVEGGNITKDADPIVWFKTNKDDTTASALVFKALNSSYPTLTLKSGTAPTEAFTTPEGEMYYTATDVEGVYVLTAHVHSYTAVITAPTCTEGGYTTYTCSCGDSYIADETAALGHAYDNDFDADCNVCGEVREVAATEGEVSRKIFWAFENGVLTITGRGKIKNFSANTAPWCHLADQITKVVIGEGITYIGSSAFFGFTAIDTVNLPNSLTAIGRYAFYGCTNLKSITIPEAVTEIGAYAFRRSGLETIDFAIGYGWSAGDKSFNITEITAGGYRFISKSYYKLDWVRNVEAEAEEFPSNYVAGGIMHTDVLWTLTTLESGKLKLTIFGNGMMADYGTACAPWYGYAADIVEIEVCEGVTYIGRCAFYGLKFVRTVTLPETLTAIGDYGFYMCYLLKTITIPESVTSIGKDAFVKTGLSEIPTV